MRYDGTKMSGDIKFTMYKDPIMIRLFDESPNAAL